ncbi:MAG: penicillin-binding protein 1B [Parasphingorhabdus sp.]
MAKRPGRKRKPNNKKSKFRKVRRYLFGLLSLVLLGLLAWLIWLDYWAIQKFHDRHQVSPAQVYSRPLEWFPGTRMGLSDSLRQLESLGYRKAVNVVQPGNYFVGQGYFDVHIRSFRYAEGIQKPTTVRVHFKARSIHKIERLPDRSALPVVLFDPVEIGTIQPRSHQDRRLLKLHDVPDELLTTLLLVEDRHFSTHFGVDPWAIARAMWANFRLGRMHQGGSTLTQQLVKNLYLTSERTFKRKFKELFYSLILEFHFEKHEILEAYVNEVFLAQSGNRAVHGFALASEHFFARPLGELETQEFALLVGMVKAPSSYNPHRHPQQATQRRNLVLKVLRDSDQIDETRYQMLKDKPLGVAQGSSTPGKAHIAYLDLVRRQLGDSSRQIDDDVTLTLWSTMEMQVQNAAQSALTNGLKKLEKSRSMKSGTLQGAVVVLRAENGQVLGLVGDRRSGYAGFNRALDARRPVGSLLKPMLLLSALENDKDLHLASPVSDEPFSLKLANGSLWQPENYDKQSHGDVSLLALLENSYNIASARLGVATGVGNFVDVLGRLGYDKPVDAYPSTLLGAIEMSPLEVAKLYLPFASGGLGFNLRAFVIATDPQGRTRIKNLAVTHQLIQPEQHYLVDFALKGVVKRGTASSSLGDWTEKLGLAGKTGTTNNYRDSWFAGYSGNFLTVVWIGRDDNQPMGLSGASGALQIWQQIMRNLPNRRSEFSQPNTISRAYWQSASGAITAKPCSKSIRLPFLSATMPTPSGRCNDKSSLSSTLRTLKPKASKLGGWLQKVFGNSDAADEDGQQESGRR